MTGKKEAPYCSFRFNTIRSLQERHSVTVKLGSADGAEIPVEITAGSQSSAEAVEAAEKELRMLVEADPKVNTTTATFWIPADMTGKVIGHQGSQIKCLQDRFSVKIGLHNKNHGPERQPGETKVEVVGTSAENVQSAEEAIK